MSNLAVQQNYDRGIQAHSCQCIDSTTKKIVVFIAGLLLLAAGLTMYYIHLNAIASYATIVMGGSLILGAAIWSVTDWAQEKKVRNLEQAGDSTENNLDIPISVQDKPRVWKQNFKRSVLEGHNSLSEGISSSDPDLTLKEETRLKAVIQDLNTRSKTDKATIHSRNGIWVFSVKEIPGRIFKMKYAGVGCGAEFHERIAASQKAQQVIEEEKLNLLHVPKQAIIQLDATEVLIEEQFDILHGRALQESLFQYCIADPELTPFVQECARQLVTLILKMGYSDVRYDNNPLLTNGKGIALIDLDADGSIITGLVTGRTRTGTDGILCCLSAEILDSLEPLLRNNLGEDFDKLKFAQLKSHLTEDAERNQQFNGYLASHGITTGKEQVTLQGLFGFSDYIKELQKTINEKASENPGLCLAAERKFYIYDRSNPAILDRLKEEGKIFDWMEITARTDFIFAFGYYVWC